MMFSSNAFRLLLSLVKLAAMDVLTNPQQEEYERDVQPGYDRSGREACIVESGTGLPDYRFPFTTWAS